MTHIMLDLETWGTKPGCDIRSIGACMFDPIAGTVAKDANERHSIAEMNRADGISDTFYVATDNPISWEERIEIEPGRFEIFETVGKGFPRYMLNRDPSTVKWWNDQSPEAQAAFANPVDLRNALTQFAEWFTRLAYPAIHIYTSPQFSPVENIRLWANDPHFDVSILAAVYDAVGLPVPWHYRAPRSFRTVTELAGMTRDDFPTFNHGTAHNALDDAISQALIVCEAYKRLGLQKENN